VTGLVEMKEWPVWANVLIGLLIGMAVIWIPVIWLLRFDFLKCYIWGSQYQATDYWNFLKTKHVCVQFWNGWLQSISEYQNPKSGPFKEWDYFTLLHSNGPDLKWVHSFKMTRKTEICTAFSCFWVMSNKMAAKNGLV
jgi:hypothetical protein